MVITMAYQNKVCEDCHKIYFPTSGQQKYCLDCSGRGWSAKHLQRLRLQKLPWACNKCGKDLEGIVHNDSHKAEWGVHHIDGNYKNKAPDNYELLCKKCHAIPHLTGRRVPESTREKLSIATRLAHKEGRMEIAKDR